MELKWFQKGFNYSQDGPGNRLVYHLQGCNLRCPWCSNPEGVDSHGSCTVETVEKIAQDVISAKKLFFEQGGLTLTGGECTLQAAAVIELFRLVRREGIHVAIETNGLSKQVEKLLPFIDLLMIDVKHYDASRHKQVTGAENTQVRLNLVKALNAGIKTIVRIPLIHGFNDQLEDMEGFSRYFNGLTGFSIELLPYHEYGKVKWERLGKQYAVHNGHVSEEFIQAFRDYLNAAGFDIIKT